MADDFRKGAVYEAALERFRGALIEEEGAITVGLTASEVAPNDGERVVLLLINLDSVPVYLAPTPLVSTTRGVILSPGGSSLTLILDEDFSMTSRQWWGLSTKAGHTLYRLVLRRFSQLRPGIRPGP